MGNAAQRGQKKHRKPTSLVKDVLHRARMSKKATALAENNENAAPTGQDDDNSLSSLHLSMLVASLQERLAISDASVQLSRCQLSAMTSKLQKTDTENARIRKCIAGYRTRMHNEGRKLQRARRAASVLRVQLQASQEARCAATHQEELARAEAACTRAPFNTVVTRLLDLNTGLQTELSTARRELRTCRKRIQRFPDQLAKATKKLRLRPLTLNLKEKGVYTARARALARLLVRAGCAQTKVGVLMQMLGRTLGVKILGKMSAHTVRRVILEGGYASDLQIAYLIRTSLGYTISGDATTNRCVNYEARHLLPCSPASDGTMHNLLLGVESSLDHTSKSQMQGWVTKFQQLIEVFNKSPLAKRKGHKMELEDCAVKLTGMGGDHAADQIKTHGLLACWKREMTYRYLARNHLGEPSSAGIMETLIREAARSAVDSVGGDDAWSALSSEAQISSYVDHFSAATTRLGKALYEDLPEDERRPLDLFMRLGCAMHKDLNSVKGGNTAMASAWGELRTIPPVLLANRENASTLRDVNLEAIAAAASLLSTDDLTAAELRALEASTRGGVKLASLAGALFNHKDDKKGHHDTYAFYFRELVGQPLRFPDTSNTRYGSYCAAAAELLVHCEHYLRFLEVVRDRKERPGFNHMEENVYRGLQDMPTLTELAVLALYGQAISHPYLRTVRVQQNGLKLVAFHNKLKAHLKTLIDNPELLLAADGSFELATMDGLEWERPEVIAAVRTMVPEMDHISELLKAFLKGALLTWERFTVEFQDGGAIDLASEAELDRAFLLPTNDHNEGALGSYRLWNRKFPNASQVYYNALAKFFQNHTAEFMETHLSTEEDQRDMRAAARAIDSSGHEAARHAAHVAHTLSTASQHAKEQREKQERLDALMAKLDAVQLILDPTALAGLRVPGLDEQLDVFRKREHDPLVPAKSWLQRRQEKVEALEGAIARYRARTGELAWVPEA